MAYIGQEPLVEFSSVPTKDSFTGDGSTVAFDMAAAVVSAADNALEVFVDNVRQEPGSGKAYTVGLDGSNENKRITFSAAPASGAAIYVINDKSNTTTLVTPTNLGGVELILDADSDTSITADTDDQIDFKIGSADHLKILSSSGDTVFKPMVDAKDIIFQQYDGNKLFSIDDGGFVGVHNSAAGPGEIRIYEDTDLGANYTGFKAGNLTASVAYQLPLADGNSGQALATNGSGVLSWATVAANTPTSADGQALGSASLEWSDLFLADAAVINFGADQDVTITHVADTGILLNTTRQLQFGDSGTYIHQSADGVLDLVSDTEIEINATTIDVNGNLDVSGTIVGAGALTAATSITVGNAVLTEAELELLDGLTAGTAIASKVVTTDANIDTTGQRNLTISGELDAATLDISGAVDVAGNSVLASVDVTGVATAATFEPDGDTAAGDTAAIGYTAAEGLILTGQGSTNDVTIKNDADADVIEIPTGTVNVTMAGTLGVVGVVSGAGFTAGSAVLAEAELELLDGLTAGTAIASKVVTTDANIDSTGMRNLTISGEIDAATGDFSGAVDIAGALVTHDDFTLTGASTGAVWDSSNNSLDFADSTQLRFGAGADLKMYHDGTNSYIVDSGTGNLKIQSSALQIMNAAGTENILLGTQDGAVTIYNNNIAMYNTSATENVFNEASNDVDFRVESNGNANMLFVDGGNDHVYIGTSSNIQVNSGNPALQINGTDGSNAHSSVTRFSANAYGPQFTLGKSRNGTVGSFTIVQDDDQLGYLNFVGDDGAANLVLAASIVGEVDGTPGANDMPGRLVFKTTADGASAGTERMRITSSGFVGIGTASPDMLLDVQGAISAGAGTDEKLQQWNIGSDNVKAEIEYVDGATRGFSFGTSTAHNLNLKAGDVENIIINPNGYVTMPLQPCFRVDSGTQDNVAVSANVNVIFSSEIFDTNADFNTGTYTFTAPVTGKYQFEVLLRVANVDTAYSYIQMVLIGSNRNTTMDTLGPVSNFMSADGEVSLRGSAILDMDTNDTALVRIRMQGGTAQADIDSDGSYFMGHLIG